MFTPPTFGAPPSPAAPAPTVLACDRFAVSARGTGVEPQLLLDAVRAVDLTKVADLAR